MLLKQEVIEEINDMLDSLSPAWCDKTLNKLTLVELLDLRLAIEGAIKYAKQSIIDEE